MAMALVGSSLAFGAVQALPNGTIVNVGGVNYWRIPREKDTPASLWMQVNATTPDKKHVGGDSSVTRAYISLPFQGWPFS